jgi:hypothetical protein
MARAAPTLLAVAVLAATALAFAVSERMKLEPSPILKPHVTAVFSPACACPQDAAAIGFTLRKGGHVSLAVVDGDGHVVRHLERSDYSRGDSVTGRWNGRDDRGRRLPDATYQPRIELGRRTIVMPNTIVLDTRPPSIRVTSVSRREISPDGDGRSDGVTIGYAVSEPAHVVLRVGARRYEERRGTDTTGTFRWSGKLDGRGLRVGIHVLRLVATDLAGNPSEPSEPVPVRVRFVDVSPRVVAARLGGLFRLHVDTDAAAVGWSAFGRHGRAKPPLLALRAPRRGGTYYVTLSANGHRATAILRVPRAKAKAKAAPPKRPSA